MFFKSPLELYVDITSYCNLDCNFCMRKWEPYLKHKDNPLLIPKIKEIVIKYDIPHIIITGGEPFLSSHLLDLVKFLKTNNKKVDITTNGTLLNRENLSFLKKYHIDSLQISIHGSYSQLNDHIMGKKGAFNAIINGFTLLNEYQIPFTTKTTITKDNISDIPQLYELLKAFKPEKMSFTEVYPIGAAFRYNLKPNIVQLTQLNQFFSSINDEKVFFQSESLQFLENHYPTRCSIGEDTSISMEILADGTALPCAFSVIFDENFNIINDNFSAVWNGMKVYEKYRKNLPEGCRNCKLKDVCFGGCPARRKLFKTDIDPLCKELGVYINEEKVEKA